MVLIVECKRFVLIKLTIKIQTILLLTVQYKQSAPAQCAYDPLVYGLLGYCRSDRCIGYQLGN